MKSTSSGVNPNVGSTASTIVHEEFHSLSKELFVDGFYRMDFARNAKETVSNHINIMVFWNNSTIKFDFQ